MDMNLLFKALFFGYSLAGVLYLSFIVSQNETLTKLGKGVLIATFGLHTLFLILRVKADHDFVGYWYAPVANIFEHVASFSWGLTLVYLISETRTGFRA